MKRLFYLSLILIFLLSACAGRPRTRITEEVPEYSPLSPPEGVLMVPENLLQRIKQNGRDINKYFLLDDDGNIMVKADIKDQGTDYELSYDLEGAASSGPSAYVVPFIIRKKDTTASYGDSLIWKPGSGREGLLLSLDDDYMEIWEQNFDLFDKYGGRITFFIQGAYDPLLTGPFCIKALGKGHDVGYHSLNHLDLRKVSGETFTKETIGSAEPFRNNGIVFSSFAYPFGFSETWMHEALIPPFKILRGYGVTYRLYTEAEIRSGYIISRAIDNTVIKGEEEFIRVVNGMLRTVKFLDNGLILPLTTHTIEDSAAWGISRKRLEYLLQSANELKLKFYRYRDFAEP